MRLIKTSFCFILLLILFGSMVSLRAEGVEKKKKNNETLNTNTAGPYTTKFNINNISTFFTYDGDSDLDPVANASGFQFPIASGRTVFYESGFLYGGYVKGEWRVSGSTYNRGQVGGRIITPGTATTAPVAADRNGLDVRIYRVRKDYKDPNADYSREIADEGTTRTAIYNQYNTDWQEWPAKYGAPYEDKNNNGQYDPAVDIPGVPGADQTIWFVCNDTDPTQSQHLYSSVGLGLEMQATIWGYNQESALGSSLFRKYTLINKSGVQIDSLYVNMWSDPDLGATSTDDFGGCDTLLSIGFIYNGTDSDPAYGQWIPASGFDFLQGPIIPGTASSQAIFKGKIRNGYINMPMTAFYLFTRNVTGYGDPTLQTNNGSYTTGALQVRNLFQGKVGQLGTAFQDPLTGRKCKFFAPGDPVTGQGWIDGILFPMNDRRIGAVSGPVTKLAAGDTQEVVVGQLAAGGYSPIDRIAAVALLKFNDLQVQQAYNNFFKVPEAVKQPQVSLDAVSGIGKASEFDRELIISWGDDAASVNAIESYDQLGYKFQGYVVYQLPSLTASLAQGTAIATYDLVDLVQNIQSLVFDSDSKSITSKVTKRGTNSGIQRFIDIKTDYLRSGNPPLANGTEYYYVVSAYAYNPDPNAVPNVLETLSARISATPHTPNPGVAYQAAGGTAYTFTHTAGSSDGVVRATVVDPSKLDGATYKVTFVDNGSGGVKWNLLRNNVALLSNQTNMTGDANYLFTNGLQIKVTGPAYSGLKTETDGGYVQVAGSRRFTQLDGDAYGTTYGWTGWRAVWAYESVGHFLYGVPLVVQPGECRNVLFKSGKVTNPQRFAPVFDLTDVNISYGYRYMRAPGTPAKPEFAPYITVPTSGSYGFQEYAQNVPFSAWNVDDPANPKRLAVGFLENNVANGLVDGKYWPYYYGDIEAIPTDNTATTGPREWIFIMDDPYTTATADAKYKVGLGTNTTGRFMYWGTWNRRDANAWTGADQWTLTANKPVTTADVYTFTAPGVTSGDVNLAKADVENINVFPNPYYAVNPREVDKYRRYVTFNHLPQKATLRVFNLAGQLVRVLEKDSQGQFMTWDLQNNNQFPVASGLYIIHVDMPDLGKTKILKLAVIQEQQILDRF